MSRKENPIWLTARHVRDRYDVSDMSLWRWQHRSALGFPPPMRINGVRYWRQADLEVWEESLAREQLPQEAAK